MKYLYILTFLFSLNVFSQNNSEINKFKNFIVINILDDNNPLIILKTDTIFNITKMNKLIIEKKTDSIILSYRLKYKSKEKIQINTPLLKSMKKLDTVFILFMHSKSEIKKPSETISEILKDSIGYTFNFSNGHYFNFLQSKYLNHGFDSILSDIKLKKKVFLKKESTKIITYKFLEKNILELENIFFVIESKVFYLIDCKEMKNGKIKLKQVNFFGDYSLKE